MIKKQVTFYLFIFLSVSAFSQDCSETGQMVFIKDQMKAASICFESSYKPDTLNQVYVTSYAFSRVKGDKLYNLDFNFFKKSDSISITCYNDKQDQSKSYFVKLSRKSSIIMIKNFKQDDTLIKYTNISVMLFTIDDTSKGKVSLHSFQPFDNPEIYITADELNEENLQKYLQETKKYLQAIRHSDSIKVQQRVDSLNSAMKQYLESKSKEMDSISKSHNTLQKPTPDLIDKFRKKLYTIFQTSLKDYFPFVNIDTSIDFVFICNKGGKIDDLKPRFSNDEQTLLLKIIENNIYPQIRSDSFNTIKKLDENINLALDFQQMFGDLMIKITEVTNEIQYNTLTNTRDKINSKLIEYSNQNVSYATEYTYHLRYESNVKNATWKYNRKENQADEFEDVTKGVDPGIKNLIPEELKNIFRNKIAKDNKTKYNIQICTISVNGRVVGHDIRFDSNQ